MPTEATRRDAAGRALDVIFVVDCSGSMAGERIAALNWAAKTVVPTMRAHAEENPRVALRIRVLRFATGATFTAPQPEPIERFVWANLAATGESDLGAAFRLLAAAFEAPAGEVEMLPPVIVLLSDGYPSDDAEGGLEALLATDLGHRAVRVPIAVGQDADMALLRGFSSDPTQPPLRSHDVEMLIGRMRWVGSGPVASAVSQGATATAEAKLGEDEDLW